MKPKNLQELARTCILIQDACNLSGVLHTWAASQEVIRDHARTGAEYMRHPANVLFLGKIASLMVANATTIGGVDAGAGVDLFGPAYDWAKRESGTNG